MTEFINCPIDLHYLAENQPSLCIPRVFTDITSEFIRKTIEQVGLGKVARVDLLERRSPKGEVYQRAFIHFEKWHWNPNAQDARKRLITGNDIKIVYNNPWFWKISANRWTPQQSMEKRGTQFPAVASALPPSVAPALSASVTTLLPSATPATPATPPPRTAPVPIQDQRNLRPQPPSRHPNNPKNKKNILPQPRFPERDRYIKSTDLPNDCPEINLCSLNINAQEFKPLKIDIPEIIPNEEPNEETQDQGLDIDYGDVPYPPPPPKLRRHKATWCAKNAPKTPPNTPPTK